jgi:tetratricopeptide (TPR) repeat protein
MSFPFRGIEFDAAYPVMRPAAAKSLQLDPMLAEGHAAMGWTYAFERDWANADAAFRKAISLNPSLTQAYTSYSLSTLQPLQRYDEALQLLNTAAIRDPLSLDVQREIGEVQLYAGRCAEAVATLMGVTKVEPDFPFVQAYLGKALICADRIAEGLALLELEPSSPWVASGYVKTGRRADAEKMVAAHQAYPYRLAIVAAALGDTQRTLEALERAAISEPHRVGRLLIEPEMKMMRDHPRVLEIRRRFKLP